MKSIRAHEMNAVVRLGAMIIIVTLGGCASFPTSCVPPAQMMVTAEMIFGRNVSNKTRVSDAAFADFVAAVVTPRFPDGLTLLDARGQWRAMESGPLMREPSKVMLLTFRDDAQKRANLSVVADAYKHQFHQQSVLTAVRTACVSF